VWKPEDGDDVQKRVERFFYAYRFMVGVRWGALGLAGLNGNVSTGLPHQRAPITLMWK
jgi:hypothetical protein